ncbi:MAG TPA: paraquat-inducible protein A [Steroidobacteraceae bacterium]|nr:paraquat-inducible protein A [Steroidobacteraceae bacterium]
MSSPQLPSPAQPSRAPIAAEHIACPDCGCRQRLPPLRRGMMAECRACHRMLARPRLLPRDATLALLLAALLLWCPASTATLLVVASAGAERTGAIGTGVQALWSSGYAPLAIVVALFVLIVPWLYFGLITYVLLGLRLRGRAGAPALRLGQALRWAQQLRPWMMIEVFLLGGCVAYSRIEQVAYVSVGVAGWCLIATTLLLLLALAELDNQTLWQALPAAQAAPGLGALRRGRAHATARSGSLVRLAARPGELACLVCDALVRGTRPGEHCPRCGSVLHVRKPHSVQRTAALALCGLLLYFPANLLPVLSLERLGHTEPSTILGGVRELAEIGLWPLAVLVFTASIVIPLAKLLVLGLNLWLLRRRSGRWLVMRTRLHRVVDAVGRWSNIDIFMLSLLVALVQFGNLTHVRAEPGATAFAAVVVLTMLAAKSFDPRLMWDVARVPR